MKNNPIGIFDSGVGGLTVLRQIEKALPGENIIYFGDTARVPYGNKSRETIVKFSTENILFLLKKKVKIVVVACNTASALALDYLSGVFNIPVFGVIEAGARLAAQVSRNKRIGIIGTPSTIKSLSYDKVILSKEPKAKVYSRACPLFVPLVEEGILKGKLVEDIVDMYLKDFKHAGIDTLILGCTHYPLLKKEISGYLRGVKIIDSAQAVSIHTQEIIAQCNIFNNRRRRGRVEFYVSDEPKGFAKMAKLFLGREIAIPKVVNV